MIRFGTCDLRITLGPLEVRKGDSDAELCMTTYGLLSRWAALTNRFEIGSRLS